MIDVIPLVYSVSERDLMGWSVEAALRRYDLALARLGVGNG